jgi:hypothetical protein
VVVEHACDSLVTDLIVVPGSRSHEANKNEIFVSSEDSAVIRLKPGKPWGDNG